MDRPQGHATKPIRINSVRPIARVQFIPDAVPFLDSELEDARCDAGRRQEVS